MEVLERTVVYLQDLSKRYDDLQQEHERLLGIRNCGCYEGGETVSQLTHRKRTRSDAEIPASGIDAESPPGERPSKRHEPLPPISALLALSPPDSTRHIADSHPPSSRQTAVIPLLPSYLPTPPPSALFQPTQSPVSPLSKTSAKSVHIPSLSLGPTALPFSNPAMQTTPPSHQRRQSVSISPVSHISSPASDIGAKSGVQCQPLDTLPAPLSTPPRTREDETAASLLLTMRLLRSPTSPRHVSTTSPFMHGSSNKPSMSGSSASPPSPPSLGLPLPERMFTSSLSGTSKNNERERGGSVTQAYPVRENRMSASQLVTVETPGSLLGLTGRRTRNGF